MVLHNGDTVSIMTIVSIILFFVLLTAGAYFLYLFLPQWDSWLYKTRRKIRRNGKVCCLTFDDGPSKEWTPQILDILNEYGIKATFFVTGERTAAWPQIVKRIADENHEIGNHTMSHRIITFRPKKDVTEEIKECSLIIENIAGVKPTLFRSPHGFKRLGLKKILDENKLKLVPWTKGLWDTNMPPSKELLKRLKRKFDPLEILLLHDGIDNRKMPQHRKATVEILPEIISEYKQRGYTFKTISEI